MDFDEEYVARYKNIRQKFTKTQFEKSLSDSQFQPPKKSANKISTMIALLQNTLLSINVLNKVLDNNFLITIYVLNLSTNINRRSRKPKK
jgi:hypothetical protein